jgi:uncharacterized membrane protein
MADDEASVPAVPWGLAALFAVAGLLHLVWPAPFVRIVPPWLPAPLVLVYASGAGSLAAAAGLLPRPTRRLAGWALALFLVAVFPANVQMLQTAQAEGAPRAAQLLLWARLPLQLLLLAWVWRSAIRPAGATPRAAA